MSSQVSSKIVACFQTWGGGKGWNRSSLLTASKDGIEAVESFVRSHYESGTSASLHCFCDEEQANFEYKVVMS